MFIIANEPDMLYDTASMMVPDPDPGRYSAEFLRALKNGAFGAGRRARIMMLSPNFGTWHLTPERAQIVVDGCGWETFVAQYAGFVLIEIERAYEWLATWLNPLILSTWASDPQILDALEAARRLRPRTMNRAVRSNASSAPELSLAADPLEEAVRAWLAGIVADRISRGQRLVKDLAYNLALQEFPSINAHWFFRHIYQSPTVPSAWTARGRPKGSRNIKGRDRK